MYSRLRWSAHVLVAPAINATHARVAAINTCTDGGLDPTEDQHVAGIGVAEFTSADPNDSTDDTFDLRQLGTHEPSEAATRTAKLTYAQASIVILDESQTGYIRGFGS